MKKQIKKKAPVELTDEEKKIKALATFLECDEDEITADDETRFSHGRREYLVCTDDEADEKAKEYIKDSLWAFNASFLASYTDLPEEMFKGLQDKCEDANPAFLICVERADGGLDGFVKEAISSDGRGHFLSQWDGNENEQGEFFIYRVN